MAYKTPVFPHGWPQKAFCYFPNSHRSAGHTPSKPEIIGWERTMCQVPPQSLRVALSICWKSNEDPLSQWGLRRQCDSYAFLGIASLLWFLLMEKIISLTWTLHLAANPGPMVVETCIYFKATEAPYFSFLAVNHQMPKLQGFHYWHRDANKSC